MKMTLKDRVIKNYLGSATINKYNVTKVEHPKIKRSKNRKKYARNQKIKSI